MTSGPAYIRDARGADVGVRWHPEEPIPDGNGGEIDARHGRATAFGNVGVCQDCQTDHEHQVSQETAREVREEFARLVDSPSEIDTSVLNL